MFETDHSKQIVIQRQMELEKEFKEELPPQLYPYNEFFGMRYLYVFLLYLPLAILGGYFVYKSLVSGHLNVYLTSVPFLPLIIAFLLFQIKDENRENITFFQMIKENVRLKRRKKIFMYQKLESDVFSEDIRSKSGIFNITKDCYETIDDALVKVLRISPINLDTLSEREKKRVLEKWENFFEDAPPEWYPIMIANYTKPVNLKTHLDQVHDSSVKEGNSLQKALAKSYIRMGKDIQGDREVVTKMPYYPIRVEGTTDASLKELNRKTMLIQGKIEDLLQGRLKLRTEILDNEELFQLIYSIIDYENSQIDVNYDSSKMLNYSVSDEEYEEAVERIKEIEKTQIL